MTRVLCSALAFVYTFSGCLLIHYAFAGSFIPSFGLGSTMYFAIVLSPIAAIATYVLPDWEEK